MNSFQSVLLDVWREVCRHIEIEQSTRSIAALLAKHLPLEAVIVRRFDPAVRGVETVAIGPSETSPEFGIGPLRLEPQSWSDLLQWVADGESRHVPPGIPAERAAPLTPPALDRELLIGALSGEHGTTGALLAIAPAGRSYSAEQLSIFQSLLEPFSVALDNDRRLHELTALREAAEADRRSLLTRLGRQEINEAIVGSETGLRSVMERVELVSRSDVPVLILGETGTGKEVASRAIHTRSARANGPFIRVNCGAIPAELIDSQLFGHEKGAFTGAAEQRKGWFERAHGGTLFLDEIGELPLPAQVRLLRVLQDHEIERVGGAKPVRVDVRIVAATHRDLAAMVRAGTFREDLWYRTNVFPIVLPPLRNRLEDIPALVRHFARRAAHRFGLPEVEPGPQDWAVLMNYGWPGNIRELGAVIDRAVILGNGTSLETAKSLGLSRPVPHIAPSAEPTMFEVIPESPSVPVPAADSSNIESLDDAMKHHIERALAAVQGRIEGKYGAAALLGINPHTLRARMRKLDIEWTKYRKPEGNGL